MGVGVPRKRIRKNITILILIASVSGICAEINDWASRSGFQLLNVSSSAKITALGGAGVGVPADFSLYSNVANYGNDTLYRLSFEHLWRISYTDLNINRFEILIPVKNVFMILSAQNHTVSNIYIRDIFPESPPDSDDFSADWQFSEISYVVGLHRNKKFDWAISFGVAFDKFLDEIAYAFIMNGGFIFKVLDDDLRIGLSFNNFGTTTPMINENGSEKWGSGEKLPTSIRTGAQYSNYIKSLKYSVCTDVLYWHVYDENKPMIENANQRFQFPVGAEISPAEWICIRGGKTLNAEYNIVNFGFGLDVNMLKVDLAASVNKYETSKEWEFLAGINLNFGTLKNKQ